MGVIVAAAIEAAAELGYNTSNATYTTWISFSSLFFSLQKMTLAIFYVSSTSEFMRPQEQVQMIIVEWHNTYHSKKEVLNVE